EAASRGLTVEFTPIDQIESGSAEAEVWSSLRNVFRDTPGFAVYHPVVPLGSRRKPPHIALLHPDLGMCVLECRPYRINDIDDIDGKDWYLARREDPDRPQDDALGNMIAIQSRYQDSKATRDILRFRWALCLPFISTADWAGRGFQEAVPQ